MATVYLQRLIAASRMLQRLLSFVVTGIRCRMQWIWARLSLVESERIGKMGQARVASTMQHTQRVAICQDLCNPLSVVRVHHSLHRHQNLSRHTLSSAWTYEYNMGISRSVPLDAAF